MRHRQADVSMASWPSRTRIRLMIGRYGRIDTLGFYDDDDDDGGRWWIDERGIVPVPQRPARATRLVEGHHHLFDSVRIIIGYPEVTRLVSPGYFSRNKWSRSRIVDNYKMRRKKKKKYGETPFDKIVRKNYYPFYSHGKLKTPTPPPVFHVLA